MECGTIRFCHFLWGSNGWQARVAVDNFSVRGSSGLHLRSIPLKTLKAFQRVRPYDLIVLQYGLNVATERGVNYESYKKGMLAVIAHLKELFPKLLSCW